MIELKQCSAQTHQGPHLQINEDAYDFDLNKNLFMILDGFGGSGIGDKCIDQIKDSMKKFYGRVSHDPDATLPFFYSSKFTAEANALINALLYTHKNIYKENMSKQVNQRAGASGVFVSFDEEIISVASTGNISVYLRKESSLTQVTIPDNYELFNSKLPEKRYLYSAPLSGLGLFKDLHYQIKEIKVSAGDSLIMMSDGIYSRLEMHELAQVLSGENKNKEKINTLFNLSNSRGNMDNQTVMILDF